MKSRVFNPGALQSPAGQESTQLLSSKEYKSHAFTGMAFILLYLYMQHRNEKLFQFGLFFFASFGAASIIASVVVFLLASAFSLAGNALSLSSTIWISLFVFPAALAFVASFIAPRLSITEEGDTLPMVIVGYGTYSLVSLAILLLGGRTEPELWALVVLILVSVAMFNAEKLFSRFFANTEKDAALMENAPLPFESGLIPDKVPDNVDQKEEKKKPIFFIRDSSPSDAENSVLEKREGRAEDEEADTVIHLGPRG
jgi:hypothetical protein